MLPSLLRNQCEAVNKEDDLKFDALLGKLSFLEREIAHLTLAIAGMASLDGAVLFSRSLDVIGFGCRININAESANSIIDVIRIRYGRKTRERRNLNTFGMRHLSAHEFVSTQPEAIAIVVSEDGDIRLFANQDGKVILYDCIDIVE
jgi:DNA integrity scanning protein DisA with diadenylate cyclase activity